MPDIRLVNRALQRTDGNSPALFRGKYGVGKLVSRSRDTDTIVQTLVGYQWMIRHDFARAFYFSA